LQEINDFELELEVKLKNLDEKHVMEVNVLSKTQGNEIKTIKITQEKEIIMEEAMHDVEMKALLERKILGSVLDTVDNGIINITPNGTLTRFNQAAESIFQYKAEEVIGNKIKMLMTDFYADQHDSFLNNYLTTGGKKLLGFQMVVESLACERMARFSLSSYRFLSLKPRIAICLPELHAICLSRLI
jgi:PAS domain-containing protein